MADRLYQSLLSLFSQKEKKLSDACHITSPPAETETRWVLRIFISIKVIVRVNQAPVHNLSFFFDELASAQRFGRVMVMVIVAALCFTSF